MATIIKTLRDWLGNQIIPRTRTIAVFDDANVDLKTTMENNVNLNTVNKSVIGSINEIDSEKLDKTSVINNLTTTVVGSALDATQGKTLKDELDEIKSSLSNPNLLINGDFQIWQRGTSFTSIEYCADRWFKNGFSATVTKVNDGLKVVATDINQYVTQRMENQMLNKTVTISISIDGIIYSETGVITANGSFIFGTPNVACFLQNMGGLTECGVRIDIAGTYVINWVKLEFSSIATPFVPRLYGEELALCQRYYETSYTDGIYAGGASSLGAVTSFADSPTVLLGFGFKVRKRIIPTVKIYSPSGTINKTWNYLDTDIVGNVDTANVGTNGFRYLVGSDFTANRIHSYHYIADAEL